MQNSAGFVDFFPSTRARAPGKFSAPRACLPLRARSTVQYSTARTMHVWAAPYKEGNRVRLGQQGWGVAQQGSYPVNPVTLPSLAGFTQVVYYTIPPEAVRNISVAS